MARRFPRLQLHNAILLALVLGTGFGILFSVSRTSLRIVTTGNDGGRVTESVERWDSVDFSRSPGDVPFETFGPNDQAEILQAWGRLSGVQRESLTVWVKWYSGSEDGSSLVRARKFEHVRSLGRVETIAIWIKPIGALFIRLLMFVAIPLVVASLIVGASSLGDLRKVGKIGAKTVGFYALTIVSAITIGLTLVNIIQPGTRLAPEARDQLQIAYEGNIADRIQQEAEIDLVDTIVRIVATNPFDALARGDMLQIVFFALIVGVSLTSIAPAKAQPVISFFDGFSDLMIRMVGMIMRIAPYGVFALIASTVAEFGFEILETLAWYAGTLILAFLIHQFVTLAILVRTLGGLNPLRFFRALRQVMLIAFSSSSSAATLPVNMEACEKNLGVPKEIASFVLPLGATINMDGTSMYQAVAAVFIAQVYGLDLGLTAQLTILLTAILASIGTAPVPGVGIVMLIIVLRSVNVPEEGIALILGVDRILDMCRTVLNVSGDATVAVIMARKEGVLRPTEAQVS